MKIVKQILFYLKVSRPGLWFATLWLYLLPTSQMLSVWESSVFWYGFVYACFPLNFMIYGWNDIVDRETDALNPRKDSFWFGAQGSEAQLKKLWQPIVITQLLFYPFLIWIGGWKIGLILLAFLVINGLYNLPKNGLRTLPPLDLVAQLGYLLIVPLSIWINKTVALPWQTYAYLFLFSMQSHLIGQVMDIVPDKAAGRRTTATILGMKKTKLLIIFIVFLEVLLLFTVYQEYIFGGMLTFALLWLLIDLFIVYKTQTYSLPQMKLFAILSNIVAVLSMAYVWYSGCLLQVH